MRMEIVIISVILILVLVIIESIILIENITLDLAKDFGIGSLDKSLIALYKVKSDNIIVYSDKDMLETNYSEFLKGLLGMNENASNILEEYSEEIN